MTDEREIPGARSRDDDDHERKAVGLGTRRAAAESCCIYSWIPAPLASANAQSSPITPTSPSSHHDIPSRTATSLQQIDECLAIYSQRIVLYSDSSCDREQPEAQARNGLVYKVHRSSVKRPMYTSCNMHSNVALVSLSEC